MSVFTGEISKKFQVVGMEVVFNSVITNYICAMIMNQSVITEEVCAQDSHAFRVCGRIYITDVEPSLASSCVYLDSFIF